MAANRKLKIQSAIVGLCLMIASAAPAAVQFTPGGIRFTYTAPNASSVSVAGSFNDWNASANPMVLEAGGVWSTVVRLGAGSHEYKFVVDTQWIPDPDNHATSGDFGNSALPLDDRGQIVKLESTSNTEYSAKILMGGRTISTFRSRRNPVNGDRFEMRRPNFDTDLGFDIRMNDLLKAHVLTNLNNEAENVEQFRTRLNFDRGAMDFRDGDLRIRVFDNVGVGAWDDPMQLVGNSGIYDHAYGFGSQGLLVNRDWRGYQGSFLYSDNFEDGGQSTPSNNDFFDLVSASGSANDLGFATLGEDGRVRFADLVSNSYRFNHSSNDEDVMAGRVTREVGPVKVGSSARLDRGYNASSYGFLEDIVDRTLTITDGVDSGDFTAETAVRTIFPRGTEQWWGVGLDAEWEETPHGMTLRAEALLGRADFVGRDGRRDNVFLVTAADSLGGVGGILQTFDGDPVLTIDELNSTDDLSEAIGTEKVKLDQSWRLFLGADNLPPFFGIESAASFEIESHDMAPPSTGLTENITNELFTYRLNLSRPIGARATASLGIESFDTRYDKTSPWENQLWFDYRNFWMENDQHEVAFDRLVLLGDDAIFWRPSFGIDAFDSPDIRFEYDGTFAAPGITREPKYTETLLRGIWKIRPQWTFLTDLRFVKYNDPILDLNDAYNETFLELKYTVAEGVEIALSYGVDPWTIDDPVNEYAYIGRDLFLFDLGANGDVARTNFFGLAEAIRRAESALADERLFQVEAIMRF